jgi:hypothetical protein
VDRELKQRLTSDLLYTFIPFAFRCQCAGEDESCRQVLNDPVALAKKYQLDRIIRYLEENY